MRKPWWVVSAMLLIATVVAPTASRASDITYEIDQVLPNGGYINGSITTNGAMGTLGTIEIATWSLGVSDGVNLGTMSPADSEGKVSLGDINVTPTHLIFKFGGEDGGDLIFQMNNNSNSYIEWGTVQCPICGFVAAVDIGGDGVDDVVTGLTQPEIIGTAVPEPATGNLVLIGATLLMMAAIRRQTEKVYRPAI